MRFPFDDYRFPYEIKYACEIVSENIDNLINVMLESVRLRNNGEIYRPIINEFIKYVYDNTPTIH